MVDSKIISKGIIYLIEHNDKPELKYIGQTKQSLGKRFEGHVSKSKIYDNMYCRLMFLFNYYGINNFSIREFKIFKNITQEQLDIEERKYIKEIGTMNTKDANEEIAIKITNEMKNELLNSIILNNASLENINKLIDKFSYDYQGNRLDFIMTEDNKKLMDNFKNDVNTGIIQDNDTNIMVDNSNVVFIDKRTNLGRVQSIIINFNKEEKKGADGLNRLQRYLSDPEKKAKHYEKIKLYSKDIKNIARRYVRELNCKKIDFDKMKDSTKDKYKISIDDNGIYYSDRV